MISNFSEEALLPLDSKILPVPTIAESENGFGWKIL